ncbi:MAG: sigma-70 family RNA polymerase sigma factor [Acidobacteria bacterium]|nr:sigma-70 family RNA polymerase sigma factor [Acidobacteriota bacterium]
MEVLDHRRAGSQVSPLSAVTRDASLPPDHVSPLVDEVYVELRRLANGYLRRERAKSIQATELVHDAYLRLLKDKHPQWQNRSHFLAIAAISMRRLLVERARARHAHKRGGDQVQVTLDDQFAAIEPNRVDVIALDRALIALAAFDSQQARVVELRFFGGLTVEETADAHGISPATVKRDWTVAKAWLMRALESGDTGA